MTTDTAHPVANGEVSIMSTQQTWMVCYPVVVEVGKGVTEAEVRNLLKAGVTVQMPRMSLDLDAPDITVVECGGPVVELQAITEVGDDKEGDAGRV